MIPSTTWNPYNCHCAYVPPGQVHSPQRVMLPEASSCRHCRVLPRTKKKNDLVERFDGRLPVRRLPAYVQYRLSPSLPTHIMWPTLCVVTRNNSAFQDLTEQDIRDTFNNSLAKDTDTTSRCIEQSMVPVQHLRFVAITVNFGCWYLSLMSGMAQQRTSTGLAATLKVL
jgi:hypothetical protein